jgi:predicted DCC family thiol-disulfide oxidoreductase YuxK
MMEDTLVYDSDCGPCTNFRKAVGFLDAAHRMRFIGLEEADRTRILERVEPSRRHKSFHLVSRSGEVQSGAAALPQLVALIPGGRIPSFLIGWNPFAYRATVFVYSVFSRLHDSRSRSYAPGGRGIESVGRKVAKPTEEIPALRLASGPPHSPAG